MMCWLMGLQFLTIIANIVCFLCCIRIQTRAHSALRDCLECLRVYDEAYERLKLKYPKDFE